MGLREMNSKMVVVMFGPSLSHRIEAATAQKVPNGAFQTVFFGFLTSACNRGNPLQRDTTCLKTLLCSTILVPAFAPNRQL